LNIEHWTTAFLRFIAIYSEKFPEEPPHLVKHAETVLFPNCVSGVSYCMDDIQVRMDREVMG